MRVAVIGLGAIGSVVRGALAGRADVVGVDRTSAPLRDEEPPVDLVIVCAKTPGTAWAADVAARVLAPEGVALTVQNGLGNLEILVSRLGATRAAAGAIYVGAYVEDGGALVVTGTPRLEIGRPSGSSAGIEALAPLLRAAGWTVTLRDDAFPLIWRKVVVNAAINPVTALLGIRNGELPGDAAGALVADVLAREAAAVARASGVPIAGDEAAEMWRAVAETTAGNLSSMLRDVRAGRETEIDAICGAIARLGGSHAPLCGVMTDLIGALRNK